MTLLQRIEAHIRRHQVTATRIGREALRDPNFVADLRRGREPGAKTVARVLTYLGGDGACRR